MAYQRGQYYYRSRRDGRGVVSEYLGAGTLGRQMAEADNREIARRKLERQAWREEQECQDNLDAQVARATELAQVLHDAVLLCSGYHCHKRMWRRRRG